MHPDAFPRTPASPAEDVRDRLSHVPPVKTALLVLGMHRSGTSAFTRLFNLLGADLASKLLPPQPDNPRGFWESADLTSLHDEILASNHATWDDWTRFDPAWYDSPLARTYQAHLLAHLTREFGASSFFVIKDPRMCRLVRLWRETLGVFGAEAKVVIPVRHPWEVARSLQSRHGFTPEKSHLIWLRHVLDAVRDTARMPRCIVSYEALLQDWRVTMSVIARSLDLQWPRYAPTVEIEIEHFLCAQDRHHVVDGEAWLQQRETTEWVTRAYQLVLAMTAGDEDGAIAHDLESLASEFESASRAFAPLLREQKEADAAERNAAVGALQARLEAVGRALAAAEEAKHQLLSRLGTAELGSGLEELDRLQSDLGAERRRATKAETSVRALESQVHEVRSLLEVMHASKSWRLTAPFRSGSMAVSRVRERWLRRRGPARARPE